MGIPVVCGLNKLKIYVYGINPQIYHWITQNTTNCYICPTGQNYNRKICKCEWAHTFCLMPKVWNSQ